MSLCYTSDLRANMATVRYEGPLRTLGDIADNGGRVFMFFGAYHQR